MTCSCPEEESSQFCSPACAAGCALLVRFTCLSWSRALASESFGPHELVDRRERARQRSGATSTVDAKPVEFYEKTKYLVDEIQTQMNLVETSQ